MYHFHFSSAQIIVLIFFVFFEIQSCGQLILLVFFYLKTPLFLPSLLRNIFLEYGALGLKLLSLSTLEILFHGFLTSIDLNSDFLNLTIYVFQSFDYEEQRSDFLHIYPPWRLLGWSKKIKNENDFSFFLSSLHLEIQVSIFFFFLYFGCMAWHAGS